MGWNASWRGIRTYMSSLNPFFVRAWVGTAMPVYQTTRLRSQSLLRQGMGWNMYCMGDRICSKVSIPSSSGHGLEHTNIPSRVFVKSLNPFFVRAWVGTFVEVDPVVAISLNPFFVRAWVGTDDSLFFFPFNRLCAVLARKRGILKLTVPSLTIASLTGSEFIVKEQAFLAHRATLNSLHSSVNGVFWRDRMRLSTPCAVVNR